MRVPTTTAPGPVATSRSGTRQQGPVGAVVRPRVHNAGGAALGPEADGGDSGRARQVVFVDKPMGGDKPRHVVSTYVQEPGRPGAKSVLSKRKTDWSPESPGKWADTRAGDTQPGLLHRAGQDQSVEPNIAQVKRLGGTAFDITEALTKAGEIFNNLRASGKGIDAFFADKANLEGLTPETNNLLIGLQENAGNPQRMAELLARYVDSALKPESAGAA